ncbi:MAG: Lrp/AsnC family transcriptional regulator [Candidatus Helarchaeota archaeon]
MVDVLTRAKKQTKFADIKSRKFPYFPIKVTLDEKDLNILEILKQNARTPFTEIAKHLKLSESTIRKRVYALEEKGIIKKYTIEIDPKLINFEVVAEIKLDVEAERVHEILDKLEPHPDIRNLKIVTGDHLIRFEFWAKNSAYLSSFISNWLGKIEGIKKIVPEIVLQQLKGN